MTISLKKKFNGKLQTVGDKVTEIHCRAYAKKQEGASAVEYALVLAVIVTLVVGVAGVMQEPLETFFKAAVQKVSDFMG